MGLLGSIFGNKLFEDKGCDWYCDNCDEHMNFQSGFTTSSDKWTCTACGYENDVSEYNIRYDDYDDDEKEDGETLSVYDAALIWLSNGKDEDYMFGYSEEELEDVL